MVSQFKNLSEISRSPAFDLNPRPLDAFHPQNFAEDSLNPEHFLWSMCGIVLFQEWRADMPHLNGEDDGVGYGVWGESDATGSGVVGVTRGPFAAGEQAAAVPFPPTVRVGVYGYNQTADVATAVLGQNGGGGLINPAPAGSGHTPSGSTVGAVWGDSLNGNGVYGSSANWNGVEGDSWSAAHAGIAGQNNVGGAAVWGWSTGNAGEFHGNHLVTG